MSGFEPFYIDTQAFRQMNSTYSNLPSQLQQVQTALLQLASNNPSYASTIAPPCEGLVFEINRTVLNIFNMHMKAQQVASQLGSVSPVLQQTLQYLSETADDMEQVESENQHLAQNWFDCWMNHINPEG